MLSRFKTWSRIWAIAAGLMLAATPAHADPISDAIALIVTSISELTVAEVIAFAFKVAIGIGLSYLVGAIEGKPKQAIQGITGTIQTGGIVPRSAIVGEYATAGSLGYVNTWGNAGETPNAYLTMRIDLSDLPISSLTEIWVGDNLCTYDPGGTPTAQGYPVPEYSVDGVDYLWVKFYDGSQTAADSFLTSTFGSDPNYPYGADMVGYGCAYVIVTARVNPNLFSGFPTFKFGLEGIKVYDPRLDSENGGSGTQRWNDPTTWAYSCNAPQLVMAVFRGFYFGDQWLFGPQGVTQFRLPAESWIAGINEGDLPVPRDAGGYEPQYRAGAEIAFNNSPAEVIDELIKACNARIAEVGGSYKILVGAATAPVMTITDDDVIITEQQSAVPFPTLSATLNALTAHYPEPAQGWATVDAPPRLNPDLEVIDGNRRLIADVTYGAVPYLEQVERLSISGIAEARRFRRHSLVLPPECWLLEPNDTIAWDSARNGYDLKSFRLDGLTDNANLDVPASLTECDPADYDYNPGTQFIPRTNGPLVTQAPAAQGILDWAAAGVTVFGDDGKAKAGIRIEWNTTVDDVDGVLFQVRLAADETLKLAGETDHFNLGTLDVTENLLPNTNYEVRGQYRPHSDRTVTWSGWLAVTTPDVRITYDELSDAIQADLDLVAVHTIEIDAIEEGQTRADAAIRDVTSSAKRIAIALLGVDSKINKVDISSAQAVANATQTLTAYTNGLVFAEAEARRTLEALVVGYTGIGGLAEFQARLVVVETATADLEAEKADVTQVDALDAQINTPSTGIAAQVAFLNEAVALLDPDSAIAAITQTAIAVRAQGQDLSSLGSTVLGILNKLNKIEQGQAASLAYYRNEIVTQVTQGVSANASAIGELGVLMVLADQTLQGSIVTEQQIRATADAVNAGVSTSILAAINGYTGPSAVAAAFNSTNAAVSTAQGGVNANVTSINAINAALTGYGGANGVANAFTSTNAAVTYAQDSIGGSYSPSSTVAAALVSQASLISGVETAVGDASAGGYFSVVAQTAPGDASARVALVVHQDSGGHVGSATTAAILLDALGDGTSRAIMLADKIYLANGSDVGAISDVLEFSAGVLTVPAAVITGTLDVGTLIADDAIITRLVAPNAISDGDFARGDVTTTFTSDTQVVSLDYDSDGGRMSVRITWRVSVSYFGSDTGGEFAWKLKRDGTTIDNGSGSLPSNPGPLNYGWAYGSAEIEDSLAAGSYNYKIYIGPGGGGQFANEAICTIAITELKK